MLMHGDLDPSSLSLQRTWLKNCFDEFTRDQTKTEKTDEFVSIIQSTIEYVELFIINKSKLKEVNSDKWYISEY
ncbi:hypothetical protein CIK04_29000 [Vibrio sp. 03_296]|nr:hypothetical protein CIK04_29000 [Vibrio sp. 03_296]